MPYECSYILKQNREEKLDQLEKSAKHLKNAEKAYKELAKLYNFETVKCGNKTKIKTIEEIHNDVVTIIEKYI